MISLNFSQLLSDRLPAWAASEGSWFEREAAEFKNRIVIYGFGHLGRKTLKGLRKLGIEPLGIIDSTLASKTPVVENLPCVSLKEGAKRWGGNSVIVVTVFNQSGERAFTEIRRKLQAGGANRVVYFLPLYWKYAEAFLPYYSIDLPSRALAQQNQIQQAFDLLADDRSREDFIFFIENVTSPSPQHTLPAIDPERTYFPEDIIRLSDHEVFVDCGAFHGDNLKKFQQLTNGHCKNYIGVEPDPANYAKLQNCIAGLRSTFVGELEAQAVGVGRHRHTVRFDSQGTISSAIVESGGTQIVVETLETILGGRTPTFIKMDVEGFELEALQGAEALLRRHLPKLAICIYHVQNHPWSVPLFIHSLRPDYKIYLRRHREYLDDVVVYAVSGSAES
jgi:FkbM family methyltransferase